MNELKVRIRGIDTPEMPADSYLQTGKLGRAQCHEEAVDALAAKRLVEILAEESETKIMKVTNFEWDKYGGRILADVKIDGKDVATMLVTSGYAVPYAGGTKTEWCKK